MLKYPLAIASVLFSVVLPAQALPVCYIDMHGVRTDLSHMCGGGTAAPQASVVAAPAPASLDADVWTRNLFFSASGSTITGNIHNSGSVAAEKVTIEATGYAEGRTPQVRSTSIERLAANGATPTTIDFGFGVPVDSWDVRVVSWE